MSGCSTTMPPQAVPETHTSRREAPAATPTRCVLMSTKETPWRSVPRVVKSATYKSTDLRISILCFPARANTTRETETRATMDTRQLDREPRELLIEQLWVGNLFANGSNVKRRWDRSEGGTPRARVGRRGDADHRHGACVAPEPPRAPARAVPARAAGRPADLRADRSARPDPRSRLR